MSLTVIGATSMIAQSTARVFFDAGHDLLLVARDAEHLINLPFDQSTGKPKVSIWECDVSDLISVKATVERVINTLGKDPYLLVAVGSIEGEQQSRNSVSAATRIIDVNFRNLVALISPISEALEAKKEGCLIIISSVSGDRGRQSNYTYGSAKAGLSAYAQGLRNRLFFCGVHVLTVKPGYVNTPMLRKALGNKYDRTPRFLIGHPDKVGKRIYRAAVKRKNVIYVQPIWRLLMLLIKVIPEELFKRMRL
jgi:short-subunit dehydrogenase